MAHTRLTALILTLAFAASAAATHTGGHGRPHHHRSPCQIAYDNCDFRFSGYHSVPTFHITGKPDRPFTTPIVSKNRHERLGVLNMNNAVPEFILGRYNSRPITHFGSQPFTPTHFKPYSFPYSRRFADRSGIGHQTFHGNQLRVARHRCVRVFITSYQVLSAGPYPTVVKNVNDVKDRRKCVVFRTA